MNVNEIKEMQSEAYDVWFERWYAKKDLENTIKISAKQGYSSYTLLVSEADDEYTRVRLSNPKTLEKLREKLVGFEVNYVETSGDRMLFGNKIGTWNKKVIRIKW